MKLRFCEVSILTRIFSASSGIFSQPRDQLLSLIILCIYSGISLSFLSFDTALLCDFLNGFDHISNGLVQCIVLGMIISLSWVDILVVCRTLYCFVLSWCVMNSHFKNYWATIQVEFVQYCHFVFWCIWLFDNKKSRVLGFVPLKG